MRQIAAHQQHSTLIRTVWAVFGDGSKAYTGQCARQSIRLLCALVRSGFSPKKMRLKVLMMCDTVHVCAYYDGWWLDVTCEQFGHKGIYIGRNRPPYYATKKCRTYRLDGGFADTMWLVFGQWPRDERPYVKDCDFLDGRA